MSEGKSLVILSEAENAKLKTVLGPAECLARTVIDLFRNPVNDEWTSQTSGILCLVRRNADHSLHLKLYCLREWSLKWEQELNNDCQYEAKFDYHHVLQIKDDRVGFNFSGDYEADLFKNAVFKELNRSKQVGSPTVDEFGTGTEDSSIPQKNAKDERKIAEAKKAVEVIDIPSNTLSKNAKEKQNIISHCEMREGNADMVNKSAIRSWSSENSYDNNYQDEKTNVMDETIKNSKMYNSVVEQIKNHGQKSPSDSNETSNVRTVNGKGNIMEDHEITINLSPDIVLKFMEQEKETRNNQTGKNASPILRQKSVCDLIIEDDERGTDAKTPEKLVQEHKILSPKCFGVNKGYTNGNAVFCNDDSKFSNKPCIPIKTSNQNVVNKYPLTYKGSLYDTIRRDIEKRNENNTEKNEVPNGSLMKQVTDSNNIKPQSPKPQLAPKPFQSPTHNVFKFQSNPYCETKPPISPKPCLSPTKQMLQPPSSPILSLSPKPYTPPIKSTIKSPLSTNKIEESSTPNSDESSGPISPLTASIPPPPPPPSFLKQIPYNLPGRISLNKPANSSINNKPQVTDIHSLLMEEIRQKSLQKGGH